MKGSEHCRGDARHPVKRDARKQIIGIHFEQVFQAQLSEYRYAIAISLFASIEARGGSSHPVLLYGDDKHEQKNQNGENTSAFKRATPLNRSGFIFLLTHHGFTSSSSEVG